MQKFENNEILNYFNEIEQETAGIETILNSNDKTGVDINTLYQLYNERQIRIDKVLEYLSGNDLSSRLELKLELNNKLTSILDIEKHNLDRLENNLKGINSDLRNLIKNKSILIYTRE